MDQSFYIKAVLFDFDGTLTKPGALNFPLLKETIGCPADVPILEFIEDLPSSSQRTEALEHLERFEKEAAVNSEPNVGAEELIHFLRSKGIGIGIITRNTRSSVKRALENFEDVDMTYFNVIVTRETPARLKPSGDGIILAAETLNVDVNQILMVGDFVFDVQAGQKAGCLTAFLDYGTASSTPKIESDFIVSNLEEIKHIVCLGLPLPPGKLPNDLLENFLDGFRFHDPSVLINAGVGEDAAAVDIDKEEVLAIKSDPITFATDAVGHYAVLINANDIATLGATPRWFLTSLLFPSGVTASYIRQIMRELESVCRRYGITLCGGHTEITDAVKRPVITGMLAGTVTKNRLVDKRNIKPGDSVLLTKAVAVEGTAIIAREFGDRLRALGMPESDIESCKRFLFSISILEEAQIASNCKGVSAMHDITEGGLATALMELSIAAEHRIKVHIDRIPIFPQTQQICSLLNIDPMGLIGSGSLLICSRKNEAQTLINSIRDAGIDIACIGEVMDAGRGVDASDQTGPVDWPRFEVDEITRLY